MLIQCYKTPDDSDIEKRLQQLVLSYVKADPSKIEELNPANCKTIYLVTHNYMQQPLWNQVRVMLGQSPRFFIVCGKTFKSRDFVQSCRDGAYDIVTLEDSDARWHEAVDQAERAQYEWLKMYQGASFNQENDLLLGRTQVMESLKSTISRVGATDSTILISGESGVGKEKVAQALHQTYGSGSFVPLNCSAIPADLLESELFGAEKGSYTGLTKDKK
jgi:DNA-binding NtrC family response regulator